jgi:SAM-dependent methyltransferase
MKKGPHPYHYNPAIDNNKETADELASLLIHLLHPRSVVDIGCGLGYFVSAFHHQGIDQVLGVDGSWAQKDSDFQLKEPGLFKEAQLDQPLHLEKKFDLALCLEVAEHLDPVVAPVLVQSLVDASSMIIFSAAVPGQGGEHHVNEQWIGYWEKLFSTHGYRLHDLLRPIIWNNTKMRWWYRQNMYLFAHHSVLPDEQKFRSEFTTAPIQYLHPGILQTRNEELQKILDGKEGIRFYLRLLGRALRNKLKKS